MDGSYIVTLSSCWIDIWWLGHVTELLEYTVYIIHRQVSIMATVLTSYILNFRVGRSVSGNLGFGNLGLFPGWKYCIPIWGLGYPKYLNVSSAGFTCEACGCLHGNAGSFWLTFGHFTQDVLWLLLHRRLNHWDVQHCHIAKPIYSCNRVSTNCLGGSQYSVLPIQNVEWIEWFLF